MRRSSHPAKAPAVSRRRTACSGGKQHRSVECPRHRPRWPRDQGRPRQFHAQRAVPPTPAAKSAPGGATGRTRGDDAHAHEDRRAPDAVEEFDRDADLVQRDQPRQGRDDAQGTRRAVREGERHQARLHELLRQGGLRSAEAPSDRQRVGRRQRRHLSRLPGHLGRGVDRTRAWSRRCCATRSR